ncbi:hypothetical protein LCGC14_0237610 [marine sediment metagenome]|uniref:N-acetyltransferase domain-containing protein n=1 Tax=marine sediment metagenome TaxID=412755 RepID=A0A0F9U882_9ZZZZ
MEVDHIIGNRIRSIRFDVIQPPLSGTGKPWARSRGARRSRVWRRKLPHSHDGARRGRFIAGDPPRGSHRAAGAFERNTSGAIVAAGFRPIPAVPRNFRRRGQARRPTRGLRRGARAGDLYWLAAHRVLTPHRGRGIARALIAAVTQRARWFDHRAVGIPATVDNCCNAALYERDGFMTVSRKELQDRLAYRAAPGLPQSGDLDSPIVWVKWL